MSKTYIPTALRVLVSDRANNACEYCLIPEIAVLAPLEIDHVIAEKHGGKTVEENLALACSLCNKHKGSDLASIDPKNDEIVRLYHPRRDRWNKHFQLANNGEIKPLSPIGRVTAKLLQKNQLSRIKERELLNQSSVLRIPGAADGDR